MFCSLLSDGTLMWYSTSRAYFEVTLQKEVAQDLTFFALGGLVPSGVQPAR